MKLANLVLSGLLLSTSVVLGATSGTGDSGGGNLYRGQPLNTYIRKIVDLPAYKRILKPKLDLVIGRSELKRRRYFDFTLEHKVWYFVPGPLPALTAATIGAGVETQQVARQLFESVWVDRDLFDKMDEDAQANLLLHESLEGFKLLRFESIRNQCIAIDPEMEKGCGNAVLRAGSPSDLKPKDYDDIRAAAAEIMSTSDSMGDEGVSDLLARFNFSSFDQRFFRRGDTSENLSFDDFTEMLKSSQLAGSWPKYLYDTSHAMAQNHFEPGQPFDRVMEWAPHGSCSLAPFHRDGKDLVSVLRWEKKPGVFASQALRIRPFELGFTRPDQLIDSNLRTIGLEVADLPKVRGKIQEGDKRLYAQFVFDGYLERIEFEEDVLTNLERGATTQSATWRRVRSSEFICSVKPHMKISAAPR